MITRLLLKLSEKVVRAPQLPKEIEQLSQKLEMEGKVPSDQMRITEMSLLTAWACLAGALCAGWVLLGWLTRDLSVVNRAVFQAGSFLAVVIFAGIALHAARYVFAEITARIEHRAFERGRRDFADRKGQRVWSSDKDIIIQVLVAGVLLFV